jgi:hypothetical protein
MGGTTTAGVVSFTQEDQAASARFAKFSSFFGTRVCQSERFRYADSNTLYVMNIKILPRQISSQQSARLGAYFAAGAAASMAASSEADAAIVFFDVNPDKTISPTQQMIFGNINLGAGTYTFGSSADPAFLLRLTFTGNPYNGDGYTAYIQWGLAGGFVAKLSYGTTIDPTAITSWDDGYDYLTKAGSGPWTGGANAYAALRIDAGGGNYNYGWVSINYDTTGPTATISGFAFEDQVNTAILAGDQGGGPAPVPEPGTMAVGAGLFALAVGAHLRRRREKKAAASDALLNLAAGARGVEKFRADKAA